MQQQEFRRLAAELKNNLARLMDKRSTWESHWQECADFMQPRKAEINKERQSIIGKCLILGTNTMWETT